MYTKRLLGAFLLAPLAGGFPFTIIYPILYPFAVISGYILIVIIGIPIVSILHWWKFTEKIHYVLSGTAIGATPFIYFIASSMLRTADPGISASDVVLIASGASAGAIGGLVFWLVARPDRLQNERDIRSLIALENRRLRSQLHETGES